MSTALASARRRRAGPEAVAPAPGVRQTTPTPSFSGSAPQPSQQQQQANMGPGLTLPQVIALVDKRLNHLEQFVQTQNHNSDSTQSSLNEESIVETYLKPVIEEYNTRFDIIADELATLKDTIMKLQTFTMEVNQSLLQDRIRILSEEPTPLEKALNAVDQN